MSDLASTRAGWDAAIAAVLAGSVEGTPSAQLRVDTKLAAAATVRSARRIIERRRRGLGGQRLPVEPARSSACSRDVETLKGHVIFDWDRTAELAGRVTLGSALRPTDMA